MTPFDTLEQFKALAETLPALAFDTRGIVHPRISLFAATGRAGDVATIGAALATLPQDAGFTTAVARADADLRLYELDLGNPTMTLGETMASKTIAYGMTAIEPGPDLFALAAVNEICDEIDVGDPLRALATSCRRDICALLGAIMATRMAGVPVIVDSVAALQAVCLLHALNPGAITHCAVPQGSTIEGAAANIGLKIICCNDARPFYALADATLHARALVIGG